MTQPSSINPETLPPEVAMIRHQLQKLGAWSPANERICATVLPPNNTIDVQPPSKTSCRLVPIVVQDALDSVDTGEYYPYFMQELIMNPILQGLFLLALMYPQKFSSHV